MLCYRQLIQLFVYCFLSINLSNGDRSVLFMKNKGNINRFQRQAENNAECQIPENPLHGEYLIAGDETHVYKTGDYVPQHRVLLLKCSKGYNTSPPGLSSSFCTHGLWQPEPRFCSRACRLLSSSKSTNIKCSFDDKPLETCDSPVEGTIAHFSCEPLYEDPSIESNPIHSCQDGDWNGIPQCSPICGQKHPVGSPTVINGTVAAIGDYPWQVGIYSNKKKLLCGGAVISPRVILSAAHCFTHHNGSLFPTENFLIAVGKHYRNYDDSRDEYSQYPTIDSIHVPPQYRGSILQYEADIAVIIVSANSLTLSEAVQPVCVDWNNLYELQQLIPNNYGVVTGWGFTREGLDLSEKLKELSIPFIPFDQCFENVPTAYQKFLRSDKICGGYLQSSSSTCQGDSGGALVFPRASNGRFYIRGIVSTSPATTEGQCDSNQYGLYTLLSKHLQFVRPHYHFPKNPSISQYHHNIIRNSVTTTLSPLLEEGSCVIPPFPFNGVYAVQGAPPDMFKPGDYVRPFGFLNINCDKKYTPSLPGSNYSICLNGIWNPLPSTCSRTCPPIRSTKTTKVKCIHNGRRLDNCDNPIADTIAEISCEPLYEEHSLKQNPSRVCRDGTWDYPLSQCHPICGQKRPKGDTHIIGIINGTSVVFGDYPWHVGVYNSRRQHICGGAILNKRVILSAAHCFADREGRLLPKENYLIAAGKYFRQYDDPRDTEAQYSAVDAIYLPERYKGSTTDFEADIAVVILTDAFNISLSVQPVCIDLSNEFENQQLIANSYGVVTGWGYTKEGEASAEELQELKVPFIPYHRCYDEVPKFFRKYITYDKICAGYSEAGVEACGGDIGGALVFPRKFNNRYFVRGIVSISPAKEVGRCDSNQYGTYTLVSKHLKFVNDLLNLNREN